MIPEIRYFKFSHSTIPSPGNYSELSKTAIESTDTTIEYLDQNKHGTSPILLQTSA
jgi:hypothetical protein